MIFAQCIAMTLPPEDKKVLWLCPQTQTKTMGHFSSIEVSGLWDSVKHKDYSWSLRFPSLFRLVRSSLRTLFLLENLSKN